MIEALRIFGSSDTRSVIASFLVRERSPLGADIDDAIADDKATFGANHVARAIILDHGRIWMLRAHYSCGHLWFGIVDLSN